MLLLLMMLQLLKLSRTDCNQTVVTTAAWTDGIGTTVKRIFVVSPTACWSPLACTQSVHVPHHFETTTKASCFTDTLDRDQFLQLLGSLRKGLALLVGIRRRHMHPCLAFSKHYVCCDLGPVFADRTFWLEQWHGIFRVGCRFC